MNEVLWTVVVTLTYHTSTILARSCTSPAFPRLELGDLIQQRSLGFVALAVFFLNEFAGDLFESLPTFQCLVTKKGQALTAR